MVKNVVIIGLCSILALETLFPNVDLGELSHLPNLISHFQQHRNESPGLTFVEFLNMHYANQDHLATSPNDHRQLPFSKRQQHIVSLQIAHELVLINPQATCIVLTNIEGITDRIVHTNNVASQVWQPPRAKSLLDNSFRGEGS
jgi:hypothetical protein